METNGNLLIKGILELEKINKRNAEIDKETQEMLRQVDLIAKKYQNVVHDVVDEINRKFGI